MADFTNGENAEDVLKTLDSLRQKMFDKPYTQEETPGQGVSDILKVIGESRTKFGLDRKPETFTPEQQAKIDESSILGEAGKGLVRGGRQIAGSVEAVGALAVDTVGAEETARSVMQDASEWMKTPEGYEPAISDIETLYDNLSVGNVGRYIASVLGEQTPVIASIIGTGGTGALVRAGALKVAPQTMTKIAGARLIPSAGVVGAGAAGFTLETGGTATELFDATDRIEVVPSVIAGAIKTGFETLTPLYLAKKMKIPLGDATKLHAKLSQEWTGGRLGHIFGEGLKTGSIEGLTEGIQETVDIITRDFVDENYDPSLDQAASRILNAAAAGFITGGALDAGLSAMDKNPGKKKKGDPWAKQKEIADISEGGTYEDFKKQYVDPNTPEGFVPTKEVDYLGDEDAQGNITPPTTPSNEPGSETTSKVESTTTSVEVPKTEETSKEKGLKFRKVREAENVPSQGPGGLRFRTTDVKSQEGVRIQYGEKTPTVFNLKARPESPIAEPISDLPDLPLVQTDTQKEEQNKKGIKFRKGEIPQGRVQVPDLQSGRFKATINDGGVAKQTSGNNLFSRKNAPETIEGEAVPQEEPTTPEVAPAPEPEPQVQKGKLGFKKKRGPQTIQIGKKGQAATAEDIDKVVTNSGVPDSLKVQETPQRQDVNVDVVNKVISWLTNEYTMGEGPEAKQRIIAEIGQGKIAQVLSRVQQNPDVTETEIRNVLKGTYFAGESSKIIQKVKEILFDKKPIVGNAAIVSDLLNRQPIYRFETLAQIILNNNTTVENFEELIYAITTIEDVESITLLGQSFGLDMELASKKDLINNFNLLIDYYNTYLNFSKITNNTPISFRDFLKSQFALNSESVSGKIATSGFEDITQYAIPPKIAGIQQELYNKTFDADISEDQYFQLINSGVEALDVINQIRAPKWTEPLFANVNYFNESTNNLYFDTGGGLLDYLGDSDQDGHYISLDLNKVDEKDLVAGLNGISHFSSGITNDQFVGDPAKLEKATRLFRAAGELWVKYKIGLATSQNLQQLEILRIEARQQYEMAISLGVRVKPTSTSGVQVLNPWKYAHLMKRSAPPRINVTVGTIVRDANFEKDVITGKASMYSIRAGGMDDTGLSLDLDKVDKNNIFYMPPVLFYRALFSNVPVSASQAMNRFGKTPEEFWKLLQSLGVTGNPSEKIKKELLQDFSLLERREKFDPGFYNSNQFHQEVYPLYVKYFRAGVKFEGSKHAGGVTIYEGPLRLDQLVQTSFKPFKEKADASTFGLPRIAMGEKFNIPYINKILESQKTEVHKTEYVLAQNVDPKSAKLLQDMKKVIEDTVQKYKLGKVLVYLSDKSPQPTNVENPVGSAGFIDDKFPEKGAFIWMNDTVYRDDPASMFETITHELGHLIVHKWFRLLDVDSQLLIRERWLRDLKTYASSDFINLERMRLPSYFLRRQASKISEPIRGDVNFGYLMSFEEWLANKISNAFTSPNSPVSKLDKLINGIKFKLVQFYNSLKGMFDSTPSITGWLKMIEDGRLQVGQTAKKGTLANILNTSVLPENYTDLKLDNVASSRNSIVALDDLIESLGPITQELRMPIPIRRNVQNTQNAMKKWKKWMKQGLGLAQLAQLYPNVKQLGEFTSLMRRWHNQRTEILSKANDTIIQWRNLGKERADRLTKFIFYIAEMEYRTPAEVSQGIRRHPTNTEVAVAIRTFNLDAEMLNVFRRQQADFAKMLTDFGQLWLSQVSKFIKDPAKVAAKKLEIQAEVANLLAAPYFPHTRFGKFGITVREQRGAGYKILEFHLTETEKEQRLVAEEMRRTYSGSQYLITENVMPEDTIHLQGMPPFIQRAILDQLRKIVTDPAQMKGVEQAIGLYALKSAPTQSFRKRFLKKKNIDGYSLDSQRVYAQYFMGASGHYSRALYEDEMRHQINSLRKEARMFPGNANTISNIANAMAMHMDAVFNPVNDWAGLRAFAGLWYLGFSPAAAATNLFQIPSFTVPYLTAHFGTLSGTKEVTKAIAEATSRLTNKWLKTGVWNANNAKTGAFEEAIRSGVLDESITTDVAAAANISAISKLQLKNKARRGYESVARWGFILFRGTEKLNRFITFESAYDLALKYPQAPKLQEFIRSVPQSEIAELQLIAAQNASGPNAWGWSQDHIHAYLFAAQAVRATQFEYGSYAKPNALRGRKGAILTFYTYIQSSLFFFRYAPGGVRALLVLAFLGGTLGLPFAQDINAIIKLIGYHIFGKDWNIEKAVREYYIDLFGENPTIPPDILLHGASRSSFGLGAFGELTGLPIPRVDLSGSLSSGRIIPGLSALEPKSDFATNMGEAAKGAFGAGVNIPINIIQALSDYQQPMTSLKRWEKAMPRAARGLSKAGRYLWNGEETNRSGAQVISFDRTDPVQLAEIVAQASGFNLTRAARKWDAIRAVKEVDYIYEVRRQLLFSEYYRAVKSKDKEAMNDVMEEIKTYNNEVPNKGRIIKRDNLRKSVRQRLKGESKFENLEPALKSQRGAADKIKKLYPEIGDSSVQEYD